MGLLPRETIYEIHETAIKLQLSRDALLTGIDASYIASISIAPQPSGQLLLDLEVLNETEHLRNGTTPIKIWLKNAHHLSKARTESSVFQTALDHMEAPSQPPPKLGKTIGSYYLDTAIADTDYGTIYRVRSHDYHEPLALKTFPLIKGRSSAERFIRQTRTLIGMRSEHAIEVKDVGIELGVPFVVMEYVEGIDLSTALHQHGKLPIEIAVRFIIEACEAIGEAHKLGFIHLNIKPSNLLLTKRSDGTDLVKVLGLYNSPNLAYTGNGARAAIGTPLTMSPEQTRGLREVDVRADIWALGVTLYMLLTNKHPFHAADKFTDIIRYLLYVINNEPTWPRVYEPDIPASLETVVLRCLQKDQEQRFASATDLIEALEPFTSKSPSKISTSLPDQNAVLTTHPPVPNNTRMPKRAFWISFVALAALLVFILISRSHAYRLF